MAFSEENGNGMVMPVAPMYGNGGGFGNGFGDNGWWIILLFLLCGAGGWGGYGYGNGGGTAFVDSSVQRGFDQSAVMSGISGIQSAVTSGFGDVQTALCGGFAGVNSNIANGFAQSEIAANARQIADMQNTFALSRQFSDCCCENRLASCQTQNVIQTEGSATRFADANNTRDIIENCNRNNQAVLDKLCALELDAKNDKIADLERQLTMANLAASQTAQTGRILADNAAQTVALEQYLNPTPVPAYVVQNPNCCTNTCGCGSF